MSELTLIQIPLSPSDVQALDRWKTANAIADRGEAARRLIQLGLKVAGWTSGEADLEPASD